MKINKKQLAKLILENLKAHPYTQKVIDVLAYEEVRVTEEQVIAAIDFTIEQLRD